MKGKDWNRLGIATDTDDLLDLSLAATARGVLEAALSDEELLSQPEQWKDSLAVLMGGAEFVSWRAPGSTLPQRGVGVLSAVALADAWKGSLAKLGKQDGAVRIAIGSSLGDSPWSADAKLIAQPIVRLNQYELKRPATSVFTQVDLAPRGLEHWPVHIGILPGESARELAKTLGATSMVRRGLANVSILSLHRSNCDVLIAPYALRELRERAGSLGFMPSASAVIARNEGFQNMAQRRMLLGRLRDELGTGAVVTGMPFAGVEGYWINELVRSLSHREPLDVAVWDADRRTRDHVGKDRGGRLPTPMVFANPASILNSPIKLQVEDLDRRVTTLREAYSSGSDIPRPAGPDSPTPAFEEIDIARAFSKFSYVSESKGATQVAEMVGEIAALESNVLPSGARPPLYGDVTFFDKDTGLRVDDRNEPLVIGTDYSLEVALRRVPSGVSHRGGNPKPVAPLPAGSAIELLVVAKGGKGDLEILQPTQLLKLSTDEAADSLPVRFHVRPLRTTSGGNDFCCVEIRVYFNFNLLEVLVVRATTRGEFDTGPAEPPSPPIFIDQSERVERGYLDLERWQAPRHLGIDIRREGDSVRFTFVARVKPSPGAESLVLPAQLDIPLSLLMPMLNRMRGLWEEIAVNLIGASLQPDTHVFQEALVRLAQAGRDLWSLLFRGPQGSAMNVIGEWLWSHPAQTGAVIDVRLLDGAAAFAFPWSLLYDRELNDRAKTADPEGFWGIRYAIGQSAMDWYQGDAPIVAKPASRLEFMLWGAFPNGAAQTRLLKDIETSSNNLLAVQPVITNKQAFNEMVRECDADMLYFYTHGHTRPGAADSGYDPVERIKQRFEQLSDEQKDKSGLWPLYALIEDADFKPDESWIALTMGRLRLQEMRAQPMKLLRSPVVFLNMCQSAQVMPGLADSFVTFFLERNARSVLGTECPMTTVFAHPFSEELLRRFFSGSSLGESLRLARVHFMNQQNPLGLAYSLFGAATVRYEPALL
jgi:CHAT domain